MKKTGDNTEHHHFIREVTVKYRNSRVVQKSVSESKDIYEAFNKVIRDNSCEQMLAFFLDGAHNIIGYSVVSFGGRTFCTIDVAAVLQKALLIGAVSLIIIHNHPSDNLTPSEADRDFTKKIVAAGKIVGIRLLDHLIAGSTNHISLAELEPYLFQS